MIFVRRLFDAKTLSSKDVRPELIGFFIKSALEAFGVRFLRSLCRFKQRTRRVEVF